MLRDTAYRVIADHLRTLTFAITDGAVPDSEGRGYVLRRILRRAVRYGMQTLGAQPGFFAKLIPEVARTMGSAFPEIVAKNADVVAIIAEEEASFGKMLKNGIKYFNKVADEVQAKGGSVIDGSSAFVLYDTMGFPVDLTQIMASERGMSVDMVVFHEHMARQKESSRQDTRSKKLAGHTALNLDAEAVSVLSHAGIKPTYDEPKYEWDTALTTTLRAIVNCRNELITGPTAHDVVVTGNDTVGIVLAHSPFYAEAGGQVADTGVLHVLNPLDEDDSLLLEVVDVQSYGGYVLHTCSLSSLNFESEEEQSGAVFTLKPGATVEAHVDYGRRRRVAPNHTMTHVLNGALRQVYILFWLSVFVL